MELREQLVSGKELIGVKRKRSQPYKFEKFEPELREKRETEGWILDKELKGSIRMKTLKSTDEIFENEVWCAFAGMGFSYLNRDRFCKISYSEKNPHLTKQIDVFAVDDETILFIECKCAQKGKRGDFKTDIESIKGIQHELFTTAQRAFPDKKRRVKYIFATKNYAISDIDKNRMKDAGIAHFDERSIRYFKDLTNHLGSSARYQLLGLLFRNQKIQAMDARVPAIRGKMGGYTYYSFSIEPERLLKIAFVLHRSDANNDMMPTYQRLN